MLILGKQIFPTSPECSNASHTAIGTETETETEASTGYMYECSSHLPACHPISSKSHSKSKKPARKPPPTPRPVRNQSKFARDDLAWNFWLMMRVH